MLPSHLEADQIVHLTAYSSGSSFETSSANPLTDARSHPLPSCRATSDKDGFIADASDLCFTWPMFIFALRISIAGIVSDREISSSIRDWQETADFVFFAALLRRN